MSLSLSVSPWADDKGLAVAVCDSVVDEDLRLCLDRDSDSDSQLELSELIESITCKEDSDDGFSPFSARAVVADIVDRILDRVEAEAGAPLRSSDELPGGGGASAREIDCDVSRDQPKSNRKADTPRKVRRKRDRSDHERKKSRRRSTSCSTTSSACSDVSRKHRRKHKHHRRREVEVVEAGPSPRVNPIFVWVKQDDTTIVEVLCEDYDKRNRIRLTKTAHGWRSVPRTERLDSTLSRSSLDLSPTLERPPPLVTPEVKIEPDEHLQTKEKQTKHCVSICKKKSRCDKRKDKGFTENNYVDKCNNVDVVNNNNSSISNNNNIKVEPTSDCSVLEPRLRSFGYKKASHDQVPCKSNKKKDNKKLDIDVYTFVSTPKTETDDDSIDHDFGSETEQKPDLKIKPEPILVDSEPEDSKDCLEFKILNIKSESPPTDCKEMEEISEDNHEKVKEEEQAITEVKGIELNCETDQSKSSITHVEENVSLSKNETPEISSEIKSDELKSATPVSQEVEQPHDFNILKIPQVHRIKLIPETEEPQPIAAEPVKIILEEPSQQVIDTSIKPSQEPKSPESFTTFDIKDISCVDAVSQDGEKIYETYPSEEEKEGEEEQDEEEDDDDEEPPPEIILPEPHLHTPEPSPPPVPEPSITEPESSFPVISLQPDTSLDSDTIHLPDTTTKSESSLLISTDISLGQQLSLKPTPDISLGLQLSLKPTPDISLRQQLSLKPTPDISLRQQLSLKPTPDISLETSRPSVSLPSESKTTESIQRSQNEIKTAEMLRDEEIERQITADLDEDHLLAIEEILQAEECVEDFDDDDLPEEYSVSPESPVNLVIDLKLKDHVDNSGIPLSLRTDDFLDIFRSPIPSKEHSETLSPLPLTKGSHETVVKPIPPAHQQSKTKFLESILSCPKRCHKDNDKKADSSDQQEPLYLGVSRKSASPTVSSSDGRKFSSPDLEPKPKRMKVEDITLKTILNKNKENSTKPKVSKIKETEDIRQTADSTTKSRLLELLTNENDEHISKLDPLTQLKEVMSDPDLNVPDPLLVPRARLAALVANPAKEIPRLLAMRSESLSYPKLLTDPDLLVVSLSHLQSLLQAARKDEEILKYQQQAQLLQQQMKPEQTSMDAATATALNQMMWLPYLSQLEAAAMACGNTQDFMTMLNMVFPAGSYSQMNPYMMTSPTPGINPYDYKSQLEFQQAFALWNEAMMQAATNQFAAQNLGSTTSSAATNNKNISKLYQNYQETKFTPKSHSNTTSKHQDAKHTSARTSPLSLSYQQSKYRASQYPYTSMFSIPTSTPTTSHASRSSSHRTTTSQSTSSSLTSTTQSQSQQAYHPSKQRSYNYNNYNYNYPPLKTPSMPYTSATPKSDPSSLSAISTSDLLYKQKPGSSSAASCKSLMNILSKPKQSEMKPSHHQHQHQYQHQLAKVYPTSTTMFPRETTMTAVKPAPPVKQDPPKLKVKQPQHLVDPNSKPKLFNFDEHGEVGSTTGSMTPHVDEAHPNLWHPLFSSHQQKSYSSPWQWTTPVTVSGE